METPLISVVMPVFNREQYLVESIESVLAQTYPHWELIIVDDGSSDGSRAIAEGYVRRLPDKIRMIAHPNHANKGISASRNLGSRAARGNFIASLDSDDLWRPYKLQSQVNIVQQHPEVGLVVGATLYFYPDKPQQDRVYLAGGPRDRLIEPPELFREMYPIGTGTAPSMNTLLLRKDVFERVGGWEDYFRTTYEDQALLSKVYLSEKVFISSEIWDEYRQHATSIMSTELTGTSYFRKRYLFLAWRDRWFQAERPHLAAERGMVRQALADPKLRFARGPVRYALWSQWRKYDRLARRAVRKVIPRRPQPPATPPPAAPQ